MAVTAEALSTLAGRTFDADQASAAITIVTAIARAYTRGAGFDAEGQPVPEIEAVIMTAAIRLLSNPSQLSEASSMGAFSVDQRDGLTAFSILELIALDRWRVKAI